MKRYLVMSMLLMLLTALPLSGCSDFNEINNLALVDMVGADVDEDGLYHVYYQIVNPNGVAGTKAGSARSPLYTFEFTGHTWAEFVSAASQTVPRQLFVSHFQAYIISERLAKKGLQNLLNVLENDPDRRMATAVLITKSPIREIMNTYVPLESNPGKELRNIQKLQYDVTGKGNNKSQLRVLLETMDTSQLTFISNIILNDRKPFTTTKRFETIEGNRGNYSYTGASIIKRGRWIGQLESEQLVTLFFARGEAKSFVKRLQGKDETASVQMIGKPKRSIRLVMREGKPILRMTLKPELRMMSLSTPGKLDTEKIRRLEIAFDEEMEDGIKQLLRLGSNHHWDLLDLENRIKHKSGRQWAALKREPNGWEKTEIQVHVQSSIIKVGMMLTPYREE
ncbi:Ger(x)C family spore germination protein [Paenibacillus sp. NFR01]|uniref:Ger(x)C family spore germination protein n=1 Tax=Paenibacillus sp. NFR01 TaxID=1566279 RepID=UPI0008CEB723|nr:Ger(x)C family spore germination protein [Paenibacillus sp. NFR01]SEU20307.1 germination protein, Ger(x)C family [Paenibacillus sp. NFR01]